MTNTHLSLWLWCQLSIAEQYLRMLDYSDPVVLEHMESEGWTKEKIITMIEQVATKANEIAAQTHIESAPSVNAAHCILRMMNLGIKFENVITAVIANSEPEQEKKIKC